ncbi:hypothetical protein [Xanthomonas sacchari]|nr:hypothetical protein [Xanthomonas sacchari]
MSACTSGLLRSTSDTVARDTPQAAAMSDTVTRLSAEDGATAH